MDTLKASLGKFYFVSHLNKPPTFLQVVGWTKGAERPEAKRQYVYVRTVPLKVNHYRAAGSWEFDEEIIKKYAAEITEPVKTAKSKLVHGSAIMVKGASFIRYQSTTVQLKQFNCETD